MPSQFQVEPEPCEPALIEESEGHRRDRRRQLVGSLACLLACLGALVGFNEIRNLKYRVCCKLKYFEPFKALTNRQNPSGVNFNTPMFNFKVIPLRTMPVGGLPQPSILYEDAKIISDAFADIDLGLLDIGRTYDRGKSSDSNNTDEKKIGPTELLRQKRIPIDLMYQSPMVRTE